MWQRDAVSEFSQVLTNTWLCSRAMRFQSRPTNWPSLTIESPVAQWLEHPTRSRRVVGSSPIWGSDFSIKNCFIFNEFLHQLTKSHLLDISYQPSSKSVIFVKRAGHKSAQTFECSGFYSKIRPLNWPITGRALTERYNKVHWIPIKLRCLSNFSTIYLHLTCLFAAP